MLGECIAGVRGGRWVVGQEKECRLFKRRHVYQLSVYFVCNGWAIVGYFTRKKASNYIS